MKTTNGVRIWTSVRSGSVLFCIPKDLYSAEWPLRLIAPPLGFCCNHPQITCESDTRAISLLRMTWRNNIEVEFGVHWMTRSGISLGKFGPRRVTTGQHWFLKLAEGFGGLKR